MKPLVYIETSVVSYLTSRFSRDLIHAAHQQITEDWWSTRKEDFEIFISQLVLDEANSGDVEAANRRMVILSNIPKLELNKEVGNIAVKLLEPNGPMPKIAATDAAHIAVCVVHEIDFLLTWNCRHIANAEIQKKIASVVEGLGYQIPEICTPEELMGVRNV